ncbi:hypothetical protein [Marivita sp. XM-24bin2]|jgi:hypothetical protein|uniref:hypothetical protein n=1 Tax=unclassified Marivita TaxID=2632480 RepID=UPI000D7B4720|nr:hypothetical protein [Marivita sp. XM-24bin2]MCR9107315.1 hypothetical protein [Paracoccaceae bacterium]PWL36563.1 MAG: hypothetical protein DCO97_03530 [Marivita sp. XM-24bin2]
MSVASLPMYWRAENAGAWRAFWSVVQDSAKAEGITLPDLTDPAALPKDLEQHWTDPDLVLSMTCGLPLRSFLRGKVRYVGTLDFGLGTPFGHYQSQVIARMGLSGPPRRLAYNSGDSQSGWAAAQDLPVISEITETVPTGAHAASLAAVAEGRADIACIDAITWRLLERFDPNASRITRVGRTRPTPGLPLITALAADPIPLRAALRTATERFKPDDPADLGGRMTFCVLDEQDYYSEPIPARPAG